MTAGSVVAGRRGWRVGVVGVLAVVLGGCSVSEVADALSGGSGGDPVLVTAAQKEALGYENPEGVRNSDLQRVAVEHMCRLHRPDS